MNTSFFQEMLGSIAERGRALVDRSATRQAGRGGRHAKTPESLESLCRALVSGRGEASGVALARQLLDLYAASPMAARIEFFHLLASGFDPDPARIQRAFEAYRLEATPGATRPPRLLPPTRARLGEGRGWALTTRWTPRRRRQRQRRLLSGLNSSAALNVAMKLLSLSPESGCAP